MTASTEPNIHVILRDTAFTHPQYKYIKRSLDYPYGVLVYHVIIRGLSSTALKPFIWCKKKNNVSSLIVTLYNVFLRDI